MVTGGTGFVGSHTVAKLVNDGHDVRLLVRSESRVAPALTPLGVDLARIEVVSGDVTDRDSVKFALKDMDALVHAASVYTMKKQRSKEISITNRKGCEIVLDEAFQARLDPIIHVSSVSAVLSTDNGALTSHESSPTSVKVGPYVDSKVEQEIVARRFQSEGAPVVITYPGAVMGPHDPHWGGGPILIESMLRGKIPIMIDCRLPIVDVRDVASLHSALMEKGKGPRRFMLSGTSATFAEILSLLSQLTDRKLRCVTVPRWFMSSIVRIMDAIQRTFPIELQATSEGLNIIKLDLRFDDSAAINDLGIKKTDLSTTMTDMVVWMHSTGRMPTRMVGSLSS